MSPIIAIIARLADNPMVMQMGGMLGNRAMMAMMGDILRINGETFVNQEGEVMGLIGGRVLVQASGGEVDEMVAHLEQIDFDALQGLGSNPEPMKEPRIGDPGFDVRSLMPAAQCRRRSTSPMASPFSRRPRGRARASRSA